VPEAFRGEWASRIDRCFLPHGSILVIGASAFGVRPISDLELEVELDEPDGASRYPRRFRLSPDRRLLTDITDPGKPIVRSRCDMTRQRVIGLVEIPALHAALNTGKPDAATAPVALRAGQSRDSAVAVTINDRRQLVSREHGYEQVSAAVYARISDPAGGAWYKLGYAVGDKAGFGWWLDAASTGTFRHASTLVAGHKAFLTNDWDGRLYARPEAQAAARTLTAPGRDAHPAVHVVDVWTERATGEDWYLVAATQGHCGDGPTEIVATGWVRAFAANGGNSVWYYARGC
jgi:hypothetical protein